VTSGFSIVRNLALGADVCNAARAMMFALGCIQVKKDRLIIKPIPKLIMIPMTTGLEM